MPPQDGADRAAQVLRRGLALGSARLDQRSSTAHCASVSISPPQRGKNARTNNQFKTEQALVVEDENGVVSAVYSDFDYIARRHRITNREQAFKMASEVIASITSSVKAH